MKALFFPLFLLACSASSSPSRSPIPSPSPHGQGLRPRHPQDSACSAGFAPSPLPSPLQARHKLAYAKATEAAERNDLDAAFSALLPIEQELASATSEPLAYWIHNELTWILWARGDLAGALDETMKGAAALDRSTLALDAIASMRLHALWDRAYLLLDKNDPAADRARADYETLASARADHDGMAVLEAFFAASRKHGKDAVSAAKRVDVEKDGDLQDLYVIALAFDAGGDPVSAKSVRNRICEGNAYLMKPLITLRMKREGFTCASR